jgi:hypothetical protein
VVLAGLSAVLAPDLPSDAALAADAAGPTRSTADAASVLPHFEANHGQFPAEVAFALRDGATTTYFLADAVVFSHGGALMGMYWPGQAPSVASGQLLAATSNYYIGADPSSWHIDVPHYADVLYSIAPGIDARFYINNDGLLEYDYLFAAAILSDTFTFAFDGAEAASQANGDLLVRGPGYSWLHAAPIAFQAGRPVPAAFEPRGDAWGLHVEADPLQPLIIDPTVMIYATYLGGLDDDIAYSVARTDLRGPFIVGQTSSGATATFPVFGWPTCPITCPYGLVQLVSTGGTDAFLTHLDFTTGLGVQLICSVYLGGSADDGAYDVAADVGGNAVVVTGYTQSNDFPIHEQGPAGTVHQGTSGGGMDAFVAIFDGACHLYNSSYFGGPGDDWGNSVAYDAANYDPGSNCDDRFWVAGGTQGGLATPKAFDTTLGGTQDGFISEWTGCWFPTFPPPAESLSLVANSYYGGLGIDEITAIDVSLLVHDAYFTGRTVSPAGFPVTAGAFQTAYGGGGSDAVLGQVSPAPAGPGTQALLYSSFMGGTGRDEGFGIEWLNNPAAFSGFDVHVVGATTSTDFPIAPPLGIPPTLPVPLPLQAANGGGNDGFLMHMDLVSTAAADRLYGTYLGGLELDIAHDVSEDALGRAVIGGATQSIGFPLSPGAFDATLDGGQDAFIMVIDTTGTPGGLASLVYSTYIGGEQRDTGFGVAGTDPTGLATDEWLVGETLSSAFPVTTGTYQPALAGGTDAFFAVTACTGAPC